MTDNNERVPPPPPLIDDPSLGEYFETEREPWSQRARDLRDMSAAMAIGAIAAVLIVVGWTWSQGADDIPDRGEVPSVWDQFCDREKFWEHPEFCMTVLENSVVR